MLPTGIFPSWEEQKSCKTTGLPLFSTDTGPCQKQGLIIPSPESNTSYPQPYFPCNVWAFAQMNIHSHTHTHTLFSWVKILTPNEWVLQKLQSNCVSWNISGAILQTRLGSKTRTFCIMDPSYSTILEPADGKALSRTAFGVSSLGSFHHASLHSLWQEF